MIGLALVGWGIKRIEKPTIPEHWLLVLLLATLGIASQLYIEGYLYYLENSLKTTTSSFGADRTMAVRVPNLVGPQDLVVENGYTDQAVGIVHLHFEEDERGELVYLSDVELMNHGRELEAIIIQARATQELPRRVHLAMEPSANSFAVEVYFYTLLSSGYSQADLVFRRQNGHENRPLLGIQRRYLVTTLPVQIVSYPTADACKYIPKRMRTISNSLAGPLK